jgi:hypothetical protein
MPAIFLSTSSILSTELPDSKLDMSMTVLVGFSITAPSWKTEVTTTVSVGISCFAFSCSERLAPGGHYLNHAERIDKAIDAVREIVEINRRRLS